MQQRAVGLRRERDPASRTRPRRPSRRRAAAGAAARRRRRRAPRRRAPRAASRQTSSQAASCAAASSATARAAPSASPSRRPRRPRSRVEAAPAPRGRARARGSRPAGRSRGRGSSWRPAAGRGCPTAAISVAKNAKSAPCAASSPSAATHLRREPREQRGLVVVAALGGQPRGVGEQQPARLDHRAHHLVVERRAAAERVHEHVEPAVGAPVAHPHRVALPDVDEPELLEALDALAHRGDVHAQRRPPARAGWGAARRARSGPRARRRPGGGRPGRAATSGRGGVPLFGTIYQGGFVRPLFAARPGAMAPVPSGAPRNFRRMPLCFIEPQDAIRVIAESVGREARRQLLESWCARGSTRSPRRSWRPTTPRRWRTSTSTTCRCSRPGTPRWRSAADRQQGVPGQRVPGAGREPARGAEDRRRLPRRGGVQRGRGGGAGDRDRAALAVRGALRGARGRVPRALLLGPARLRELGRGAAQHVVAADALGAVACQRMKAQSRRSCPRSSDEPQRTSPDAAVRVSSSLEPQLQAGAALVALAVVGRRQPRVADASGRPRSRPAPPTRAPRRGGPAGAGSRARRRRARAEPGGDGAGELDPAPVGLAPCVPALAEAARPRGPVGAPCRPRRTAARSPPCRRLGDRLAAGELGRGGAPGARGRSRPLGVHVTCQRAQRRLDRHAQAAELERVPVRARRPRARRGRARRPARGPRTAAPARCPSGAAVLSRREPDPRQPVKLRLRGRRTRTSRRPRTPDRRASGPAPGLRRSRRPPSLRAERARARRRSPCPRRRRAGRGRAGPPRPARGPPIETTIRREAPHEHRRASARVGGSSSAAPRMSERKPGVSSSAPPNSTSAPSSTSRAGGRPALGGR